MNGRKSVNEEMICINVVLFHIYTSIFIDSNYSKTCVKRPLKKDRKLVSKANHRLMQGKSIAEFSKGSILHSF